MSVNCSVCVAFVKNCRPRACILLIFLLQKSLLLHKLDKRGNGVNTGKNKKKAAFVDINIRFLSLRLEKQPNLGGAQYFIVI
jgi:hypothetical protein